MTIFTQKLVNFTNNYKIPTTHPIKHEFLKTYCCFVKLSVLLTTYLVYYYCLVSAQDRSLIVLHMYCHFSSRKKTLRHFWVN